MRNLIAFAFFLVLSCGGGDGGSTDSNRRVFYVDSASGNDSNSGDSESNPWKSIARVNSQKLQPGDTVLFKRGLNYEGALELTSSGTESDTINFDAYGSGSIPVFSGSKIESGWTNHSGNIYKKTMTYTPGKTGSGIVLEDGTPLKFRSWNTNAQTSLGSEKGVFTYDPGNLFSGTIYIACTDSANPSTHSIEAGFHLIGIHGENISNINIRNIHFKNYSCHGISLRNSNDINVSGCKAENTGGAVLSLSPLLYGGNGFEFTLNSSNCSVENSSAVNIFDSGFSPQVFENNTLTHDIIFNNCVADKCGFAGIEISVLKYGTSSDEKLQNISVDSCTVTNSGKGFSGIRYGNEGHGIRIKADTDAGSISGVSISNSTIQNCESSGIYIGGEAGTVDISRCKISGNNYGIQCAGLSGVTSLKLILKSSLIINQNASGAQGIAYNVATGSNFEIINNTFCNNVLSFYIGTCGAGTRILKNNVFYSSNSSHTHLYCGSNPAMQSDYNCFYQHGGNIIGWNGTAYGSVSAFNSTSSTDANSIGSDPQFINSSSDWNLQSGSPCKNSGISAGVTSDYAGNTYGNPPSRGAFR
ncbi:MAG: hypothetical protein KAZ87_08850 [Spirochaetes bacterium]|nr:hypothetical protein [Spirochaetota bacterium]